MNLALEYGFLGFFVLLTILALASAIFAPSILGLRPRRRGSSEKERTYEFGNIPIGSARMKQMIQYYPIIILFLVFDVEVALLYPWAVYMGNSLFIFIEAAFFLLILMIGWYYAYRVGGLRWLWRRG